MLFNELVAIPCITFKAGFSGGSCDTAHQSGSGKAFTGPVDMLIDRTLFGTKGTFDFPYVEVKVPFTTSAGGVSSLWGLNWST
jgi:hypothetical protein